MNGLYRITATHPMLPGQQANSFVVITDQGLFGARFVPMSEEESNVLVALANKGLVQLELVYEMDKDAAVGDPRELHP
jgi:hypothetical protein